MQLRQHLPDEGFIHRTLDSRLVESRCRQCGLIVAASQSHWILELAESQHTCPVYLNYGYTGEAERIKPH